MRRIVTIVAGLAVVYLFVFSFMFWAGFALGSFVVGSEWWGKWKKS